MTLLLLYASSAFWQSNIERFGHIWISGCSCLKQIPEQILTNLLLMYILHRINYNILYLSDLRNAFEYALIKYPIWASESATQLANRNTTALHWPCFYILHIWLTWKSLSILDTAMGSIPEEELVCELPPTFTIWTNLSFINSLYRSFHQHNVGKKKKHCCWGLRFYNS